MSIYTRRRFLLKSGHYVMAPGLLALFERQALGLESVLPRLVTFSFPNGCPADLWNYEQALSPLLASRDTIVLYQNLKNEVGELAGGDGHQQGGVNLFTGKALLNDVMSRGASLDQIASQHLDRDTVYGRPLVQGVWSGFAGGAFRPTTWSHRSWLSNGLPARTFANPLDCFYKLFGLSKDASALYQEKRKSVLDAVLDQYSALSSDRSNLAKESKVHLDRISSMIRDEEKRHTRYSNESVKKCSANKPPNLSGPAGILPYDLFQEAFHHQIELVILAFQCNLTRTASLMFGGSGEEFKLADQKISDHAASHFANDSERQVHLAYRRFHMANVQRLIERLMSSVDSNGRTLLQDTILLVGSEFGDGRAHVFSPQPHLIATANPIFPIGTVIDVQQKSETVALYKEILTKMNIPT